MITVTNAVYDYLNKLQDNTRVSGWELFDKMLAITGKHTYPSTLLSYCRDYCDITGGEWECIDKKHSIYIYHKGITKLNRLTIYIN